MSELPECIGSLISQIAPCLITPANMEMNTIIKYRETRSVLKSGTLQMKWIPQKNFRPKNGIAEQREVWFL